MIVAAFEQRNPYKGEPQRPWIRLRLEAPDGSLLEGELLADTGNPYTLIVPLAIMARLKIADLTFRYQVLRVWQLAPEPLWCGGVALLPFAPIRAVTEAELPGIIKQMERRLSQRQARRQASLVWASSYILLGLRYSPTLAEQLCRSARMRGAVGYLFSQIENFYEWTDIRSDNWNALGFRSGGSRRRVAGVSRANGSRLASQGQTPDDVGQR